MVAALGVGLAAGLFNGLAVAVFGLPPILATLGSGLIFTGIAIALTGGSAIMGFPAATAWLGNATLLRRAGAARSSSRSSPPGSPSCSPAPASGSRCRCTAPTRSPRISPRVDVTAAADPGLCGLRRLRGDRRDGGDEPGQLGQGRLRLVLPAARGADRGARRRQSLRRLRPGDRRGARGALDAVPVLGAQHARGVELRPRADLGRAAPPRHGGERRQLAAPAGAAARRRRPGLQPSPGTETR